MTWSIDARIPVSLAAPAALPPPAPDTALLLPADLPAPPGVAVGRYAAAAAGHPAGCACCAPRGAAAEGLSRLFHARARGEIPFFHRVLAVARTAGEAEAIRAALERDPMVAGRFREEAGGPDGAA